MVKKLAQAMETGPIAPTPDSQSRIPSLLTGDIIAFVPQKPLFLPAHPSKTFSVPKAPASTSQYIQAAASYLHVHGEDQGVACGGEEDLAPQISHQDHPQMNNQSE